MAEALPAAERAAVGEIAGLRAENARLRAELAAWQQRAEGQRAEIGGLQQRLEELERQVGLHSANSGKPPSSDGPRKPPAAQRTRSQRGRSGKRSGGQPGHRGATLQQTARPDHIESHLPPHCGGCGALLSAADSAGRPVRRQVFDLPPPRWEVTEHRAQACRCGSCGQLTRAAFPAGVNAPVQYGPRLAATAVYLQNAHFLPEERLAEIFRDLHGVRVCAATLAGMTRQAAERWRECSERVRDLIAGADSVKHLDETGFRIDGRTQWLHVIGTPRLTFYRPSARRGSLLEGLRGCLVHDHWKPYFTIAGVRHALCNAHHLRELQALADLDGEAWAGRMQRLLRRAGQAARIARERGIPLPPSLVQRIERHYDSLVARALAEHAARAPLRPPRPGRRGRKKRRPGHNLALRLRDRKEAVLRFVHDPCVPFTNNLAERDLRMMKLRMKISGGFRSRQGAQDFATLRSVLSTARKQGRNRIEALRQGPAALLAGLQS